MELHNFSSRLESRAQDLDGAMPEHAEEDLSETYHHALRSFTRVLRGGGVAEVCQEFRRLLQETIRCEAHRLRYH